VNISLPSSTENFCRRLERVFCSSEIHEFPRGSILRGFCRFYQCFIFIYSREIILTILSQKSVHEKASFMPIMTCHMKFNSIQSISNEVENSDKLINCTSEALWEAVEFIVRKGDYLS
jgi:hypothetical protein